MRERGEITNDGGAIHEQLERHRRVWAVVLLDEVPHDKPDAADDEGREDVRGGPGELLAAPYEADGEYPVGACQAQLGVCERGKRGSLRDAGNEDEISDPKQKHRTVK